MNKKTVFFLSVISCFFISLASYGDIISNATEKTWSNLSLGITNAVYHNIYYRAPVSVLSPERLSKLKLLQNQIRCTSTTVTNGYVIQKYVSSEKSWLVTNKFSYVFGKKMKDKVREKIESLSLTNSVIFEKMTDFRDKYTNSVSEISRLNTLNDILKQKYETMSAKFVEASNNLTNANLKISTATLNLETMKKKFPLAKSLIDSIKAELNGE